MKKEQTKYGRTVVDYKAHRPSHAAGKILKEYRDKDGVRMYRIEGCENPFIADTHDRIFKPERMAILPKSHKGKNPDGTHIK